MVKIDTGTPRRAVQLRRFLRKKGESWGMGNIIWKVMLMVMRARPQKTAR
jgi:hypothetical protein